MPVLNDVHSRLNATEVAEVVRPRSTEDVCAAIAEARGRGLGVSIAGARHAMGGQQFGSGCLHLDMTDMDRPLGFDAERGLLRIEGGAAWPAIIRATRDAQPGVPRWGIRQKQTGADDLTLAGAISANAHGRGLTLAPIAADIEELTLVTPDARVVRCARDENAGLFALVRAGHGLFGVIADATLRLGPRVRLRRLVDVIDIDDAMNAVQRRVAAGCLYGDFQYAIDPSDDSFLRRGVFACYEPVPGDAPGAKPEPDLTREAWLGLLTLAHTDKREAFARYSRHYLATHGRVYWSDTMQLSTYIPSYAEFLARALPSDGPASLMITELFVPPDCLIDFLAAARRVLRETGVQDIYGTIRAVRADGETFLPWASGDRACVIFNLHTRHTAAGIDGSRAAARGLIDAAADLGGSFFLTYHRWATRAQLLRCHPRLPAFLAAKRRHDPEGVFQSEWYRHVRATIGDAEAVPP